jgi:hypothetical protein
MSQGTVERPAKAPEAASSTEPHMRLTGILPPVAMPFDASGEIHYPAIAEQST